MFIIAIVVALAAIGGPGIIFMALIWYFANQSIEAEVQATEAAQQARHDELLETIRKLRGPDDGVPA
jgi:hypothetical protein